MAYRFEFNRFADIVVPVMEDSGIIFDYEMSVSTGGEHIASCCCDACEADPFEEHIRPDDVEYSDVDGSSFDAGLYINYGLNGYSNPFLDFSAVQIHEHDHGSKDDDGPLFSGVGDEYADDAANTNGLGLGSITIGGRAEGVRHDGNDIDFFEVDLVAGQEYIFIMLRDAVDGQFAHADPLLRLFGTDGTTQLASNDDFGGQNSRITFTATETGTYYLGASGYSTATGGYTVFAEESDQRPDFTLGEIANFLTDQFSTRSLWNQTTITYNIDAIDDGAAGEATRADGSAYSIRPLIEAALDAWAEVTGLNFVEVTGAGNGDITFIDDQSGAYSSSTTTAYVNGSRTILSSTINVSHNGWIDVYGDGINSYSYQTYLHEIGHTLGLGHGGAYNGSADYGDDNTYLQDSWATTVMSYFSHGEAGVGTSRLVLGLQSADLLAIHDLYGAAPSTRGGDTVYGANTTEAGSIYDFDAWDAQGIRPPSFAIYDTGGIDTFDVSIYSTNQTINLMPSGDFASFSSVGNNGGQALSNIITIAVGTIIENAIGGSGNDTITGNDVDNELEGNGGNDILDGGEGTDYAVYNGAQSNYTITDNGDGTWTITGEGTDTLSNIEFARFTDGDFALENTGEINGTSGDDSLILGTAGNDVINGLAGDDTLAGLEGNDVLNGDEGDDFLEGGIGADVLNGGADFDLATYSTSDAAVTVNLATGLAIGGHASGDSFINIEGLSGSDFDDTLTGDANTNVLSGRAGNDTLDGGASDDFAAYLGVLQSDLVVTDNMDGTYTVQDMTGTHGTDTLSNIEFLFFDNDVFVDITTLVSSGPIEGTSGDDVLNGTAGDDVIRGLEGDDVINALAGDDLIILDNDGADIVDGGDGFDTVQFTNTGEGSVVFFSLGANVTNLDINVLSFTDSDLHTNLLSNVERFEQLDVNGGLQILALNLGGFDDVLDLASEAILGQAHIFSGDGNDTIIAGAGYDGTVTPQSFGNPNYANFLFGGAGDDIISGNIHDDYIGGGAGADILDGGAGEDIVTYQFSSAAVIINLETQTVSGGWATGDVISNFERAIGSDDFGDTLIGSSGNNHLAGRGGDDIIDGGEGDDLIEGGFGTDMLSGGLGADIFTFADYTFETDAILDLDETDLLLFMNNASLAVNFIGQSAFNLVAGEIRYEVSGGQTFVEVDINGDGFGEHVIVITNGEFDFETTTSPMAGGLALSATALMSSPIDGTSGNDNILGTLGDDVINGFAGNDVLDGSDGDDILNGGDGADRLIGWQGADALNGGAGFDSADYRMAFEGVAFNVVTGGTGGQAAGDTFSSIERYYLSDFTDVITGSAANEFFFGEGGNDTINGGGGIDRIDGGAGNDILRGQEGNDLIFGSAGGDQINGGTGFDVASYENSAAAVTVSLLTGGTGGDAAGDTYFGIEVVRGSDFNDSLTGNNSVNELRGGEGDDMLFGLGGNDRFFGGQGADSFDGGTGVDIVNYTVATAGVTLDLATGGTGGEAAGDTFISIEWVFGSNFDDDIIGDAGNNRLEGRDGNDTLDGAAGNDRLLGGNGNDTIFGGDGVDTIFGQDGDDILFGGAGNDFFFGGSGADSHDGGTGTDTVSYLASSSGVTVNLQTGGTGGDAAGDTYTNIERIFGTSFDDNIRGSDGNDVLLGNGGDDFIDGGAGNDTLIGGAGIDSFGYSVTQGGADVISGFFVSNEVIYFTENGGGEVGPTSFQDLIDNYASDVGTNVIFDIGNGNTLTLVGVNIADLSDSNFDFGGMPPAAEPLNDLDAFAEAPVDVMDMDALI